jgi:putative transposase
MPVPQFTSLGSYRRQRQVTLDAAYATNPARFRHRRAQPPKLPTVAWINEPTEDAAQTA